jgi:periplasmic protein TonB
MKRNENKVPGFDDIIFRNRNKSYGAYDLRKRYKATATLSLFGVSAFFIGLMLVISSFMSRKGPEPPRKPNGDIVYKIEKIDLKKYVEPDMPKPVNVVNPPAYVAPNIVDTVPKDNKGLIAADDAFRKYSDDPVNTKKDSIIVTPLPETDPIEEPLVVAQEQPEYPGGPAALYKFIGENINYPQEAIEINLQGKVILKFAVWSDGSVRRIEVLRGISPVLDQEAIRVIGTLPKWKPGKQNGVPVPVWYSVPVTFRLAN